MYVDRNERALFKEGPVVDAAWGGVSDLQQHGCAGQLHDLVSHKPQYLVHCSRTNLIRCYVGLPDNAYCVRMCSQTYSTEIIASSCCVGDVA